MRLFIVGIKMPPETFLERKIQGLSRRGIDIVVYSGAARATYVSLPNTRFLRLLPRYGWRRVVALPELMLKKTLLHPLKTWQAWRTAQRYSNEHKEVGTISVFCRLLPFVGEKPDIIHFEWNSAAVEYLPLFEFYNAPVVISCRGSQVQIVPSNPKRATFVDGLRITFEKAAAVHCVSAAICNEAATFGLDCAKAHIIRPAVDPAFFEPDRVHRVEEAKCCLVTTGSLIWRKGYEYALLAMYLLKQRGHVFDFEIIGDGPERQRVLYTVLDLGLASHVNLTGKKTPLEVKNSLQRADIFLLSSLSEGISNAVLEAMACGLPIVTTDCGGMREAITDGEEGYVVPVRDPEAMANALEKLIVDTNLRRKMGVAARTRILKEFTLEQQIEQYLALYGNLVRI